MSERITLVIEAGSQERRYWRDLWQYRELFYVLAWRDIAVRYKQTLIGVAWALIKPFTTMVVFTVLFSGVANLKPEGNEPYALMVFAALLPWQFFSSALSDSSNSLTANSNLIGKVYFPRIIIPISAIVVAFIDFLLGFLVLIAMMFWYQFSPGWEILLLPFLMCMCFMSCLGLGIFASAINVKYRDFRYIIPFCLQIGLYVSPVGFSSNVVPEAWRLLYYLNPMAGVIDGFRWSLLGGTTSIYLPGFILSCAVILILLLFGIQRFRRVEKSFADFG